MGGQSANKFTWVIENFSEIKDEAVSPRFTIGGFNWRLIAFPKGNDDKQTHLSVYLYATNAKSSPYRWQIRTQFTLSVVNQFRKSQTLSRVGESWFNADQRDWGYLEFMPLTELKSPTKGFLVNNSVIIEAKIRVHGTLDIKAEGVYAAKPSSDKLEGDEEEIKICKEVSSSKNPQELLDAYEIIEGDVAKSDGVAPKVCTSKNPQEPLHENEIVEADVAKSDDAATSVCTSKSSPCASKSELKFHTIDVNGFMVYDTQVEQVQEIFEKHLDMASNFRPKSQQVRTAYMNVLLNLIEALCRSPQDITEDDLSKGLNVLIDLEDAGFKLDWLKANFDEISKRKERADGAQIGELEKEFEKLKLMMSDLEAKLVKEKEEVAAVKVPLSFSDLVSKLS